MTERPVLLTFWASLALVALAFALRVFLLGAQGFWLDEGYTAYVSSLDLAAIPPELADNDIHPPMHYLALHGWQVLAGSSEFSLRFLSAALGVLAIPLLLKLGALLFNRSVALVGGLVLTVSPLHVWYSQEARMYGLLTTLSLLSMYLLVRAILNERGPHVPSQVVSLAAVGAIHESPLQDDPAADSGRTQGPPLPKSPDSPVPAGDPAVHFGRTQGQPLPEARLQAALWIAYSASTGSGLLTHYYAFLLLPVGLAAVLLVGRNWSTIGKWMAAQAGAAAIFAFWLPGAVNQWGHDPHVYRFPVGLDQVIANVAATLTAGDQAFAGAAVAITLALSAILIAGVLALANRGGERPTGLAFTLIYLAAPVLLAYLLASWLGVNIKPTGGKYFIILLPPYALLLASGILSVGKLDGLSAVLRSPNRRLAQPVGAIHESPLRGRGAVDTAAPPPPVHLGTILGLAAIAFLVLSSSYLLYNQYFHTTKEDFRAAARYIEDHEWPGDAIILNAEHIFSPFAYYYRGKQEWHRAAVGDTGATGEWLAGATRGRERVWLLLSHDTVSDPEGQVESWLDHRGLLVDEKWFPGMKLAAYLMSPHPASLGEIQFPVQSDFGRKVRLLGYSLQPTHPEAKSLRLILFWQGLDRLSEDLHVNLGLFDGQRRLWSQWDKEPLAPAYTTSRWVPGEILKDYYELPIPPGTPPGDYLLGVRLYSPSSGYGLEVSSVEGPLQRDELRLGTVSLPGRQYVDAGEAARSIATPATTDLGGGLMLVGGTLGSAALHPGTSLDLTLLWKVVGELDRRSRVFVELVGDGGAVWGRTTLDHQSYAGPWQQGALVRERVALAVPKAIASGRYVVRLGIEGKPASGSLGGILVQGVERSYTVPTVQVSQAATLGQAARFLGYDLPRATLVPGDAMDLTLYWQAAAPMDQDYTVFVHLLDAGSAVVAQRDNMPAEGTRPTSTWLSGEVIEDKYRLLLPRSASPGAYAIEVGMYLASTGNRLPVSDPAGPGREDRVLLRSEVNLTFSTPSSRR